VVGTRTTIIGDVGLSPGVRSSITNVEKDVQVPSGTGTIYAKGDALPTGVDTMLQTAKNDVEAAYTNARNAARGTWQSISGNLNGLTLYPGLYEGGTLGLSPGGQLYLDAQGNPNAVFVIRSTNTIITDDSGGVRAEVHLTGGAKASNVYWVAASSVTLGVNTIFKGTIIAAEDITLKTNATLDGRILVRDTGNGAIVLDTNTITVPAP
jgi:hypothetical protein